jgi:hypothetical protein
MKHLKPISKAQTAGDLSIAEILTLIVSIVSAVVPLLTLILGDKGGTAK